MEKKLWFTKEVEDVEKELGVNVEKGLSIEEAQTRQEKYGLNELKAKKKKSLVQKFIEQFKDFSIIVLIIAAIVSGAVGIANGEGITAQTVASILPSV